MNETTADYISVLLYWQEYNCHLVTLLARHNMVFIVNLENCVAFYCEIDPHFRHKVVCKMGEGGTYYYRETNVHVALYLAPSRNVIEKSTCKIFCNEVVRYTLFLSLHQGTPLHVAAESGNVDIVGLLIDKGADLSIINEYGVSE